MFFESWEGLGRVLIVGTLAYAALVVTLRLGGKRTLSKMTAFDLVVTVALGSTLATILLNKDVALAEGVTAFALLAALQTSIAWASMKWRWARRLIKSDPALVLYRGQMLHGTMRNERVGEDEIRSAVRAAQIASMNDVEAVVLETDGSFSVIKTAAPDGASSLHGLVPPSQPGYNASSPPRET